MLMVQQDPPIWMLVAGVVFVHPIMVPHMYVKYWLVLLDVCTDYVDPASLSASTAC